LKRHLPVLFGALDKIRAAQPDVRARMVLPNQALAELARSFSPPDHLEIQVGSLAEALAQTTIAIASTGTVTMECALFGVPTIALYKTSWSTYQIGKRIIQVKYLAMPNLLANEALFPEFIQHDANTENIARAALELLNDAPRREVIRTKLTNVIESLGGPGASQRAARAIGRLL
jgi:lipid-A-disaccharide synthase